MDNWHNIFWHGSSPSSAFPSYISGVHHFEQDFCVCTHFFNPTTVVVTFCLCGWDMLGVFLLLAYTCLGHERQDLLSPWDGRNVSTDLTLVYTLIRKSLGRMKPEPMLTPREKSALPENNSTQEDWTSNAASSRTASPTRYQQVIPAS